MVSAAKIDRLTDRIVAYRFWRYYKRKYEERRLADMPLELKGLKAKAMAARAHIGKLDEAYDAFNAKAGSHISDVQGLAEQLGYMADDLAFSTAALGNSVAASNEAGEAVQTAKVPLEEFLRSPVFIQPNPPNPPQQPPAAPPAIILNGSPGMRGDVQLIRS
jgi:hypothetical protein